MGTRSPCRICEKLTIADRAEYDGQPQGALDSLSPLPFLADLKPILSSSKPIINASFFELAPQPSGLYSSTYPTWEVWQFRLKPGKTIEEHYAAFKPNSSFFTKTGRPFTANISTSSSDGQQYVLYIIGWKSTKEHMDARKSPGAAAGFKKIQANIQDIVTFGHIQTESSKAKL